MPFNKEVLNHQSDEILHSIRIDELLEKVLSSASFNSSKQCQNLLRYLVEKSHQQGEESLKERVIGTEVFGRKPDYNTGDDPIVRARVGEVRKRLAQYYLSEEANHSQIQLSIPSGSYRVVYKLRDGIRRLEYDRPADPVAEPIRTGNTIAEPSLPLVQEPRQGATKNWIYMILSAGVALACLIAGSMFWRDQTAPQNARNQFWSPILRDSKPVLIYAGTNAIYAPIWSSEPRDRSSDNALVLPPLAPGVTLTSKEIRPINYEYTTVGDLLASVQIASLLSAQHVGFEVRTGENIAIGDLRHSPSILIGGANNFWTMEMSNTLPITFMPGVGILDKDGNRTVWTDKLNADSTDGESYAIVARLVNSDTGNPLIIIAGISSWGTRAAGQFITDPVALKSLAATSPKGWGNKNLEVVLRTKVLRRDAGPPTIIATRYW